jgi:hypothetical protein
MIEGTILSGINIANLFSLFRTLKNYLQKILDGRVARRIRVCIYVYPFSSDALDKLLDHVLVIIL